MKSRPSNRAHYLAALCSLTILAESSAGCVAVQASGHADLIKTDDEIAALQRVRGGFGITTSRSAKRLSGVVESLEVGALESDGSNGAVLGIGLGYVSVPNRNDGAMIGVDLLARALVTTDGISQYITSLELGYYPWTSGEALGRSCEEKRGCGLGRSSRSGWGLTAGVGILSDEMQRNKEGFVQLGIAWKFAMLFFDGEN